MLQFRRQLHWRNLQGWLSTGLIPPVSSAAAPTASLAPAAADRRFSWISGSFDAQQTGCKHSIIADSLEARKHNRTVNAGLVCIEQKRFASADTAKSIGLKYWKPTSPGQRFRVTVRRTGIWKGKPKRSLTRGAKNHAGRNSLGVITVRHRGGGHKKKLRMVDFKLKPTSAEGTVERLEYDPGRTGYIALVKYGQGDKQPPKYSYMLAPQRLVQGDKIQSGADVAIRPGNTLPLRSIPPGIPIFNLELVPGAGGKIVRAAGCSASILNKTEKYATIRLPSGEQRLVHLACQATIGSVSNPNNKNIVLGKAGYNRWRGRRPAVRGIAMNPVDHPHGGRTNGGRPSSTPWGMPCKGYKTRKHSKVNRFILVSRHKAKRT